MKGENIKTTKERFEAKFEKRGGNDCWGWTAGKFRTGYGKFSLDGRTQYAHRVAYQLYIGEIPDDLCVCHRCDNPACVNPEHLFPGTQADNMHDCDNKSRRMAPSGEKHHNAKLTEDDVRTIRMMHANGVRNVDLAREFGVAQQTISKIVHGNTWAKI